MSQLLESAARLDPQRAADLMDDEALEREMIAADLAYLERRKLSDERRLQEVALFEMDVMRRLGYL